MTLDMMKRRIASLIFVPEGLIVKDDDMSSSMTDGKIV